VISAVNQPAFEDQLFDHPADFAITIRVQLEKGGDLFGFAGTVFRRVNESQNAIDQFL